MVYLDTGCLVKLYYPEPDSALVIDRVAGQEIVYTPLHDSLNAAAELAKAYAAETGCRALDALHCAWAKNLQITGFLTTDARQHALARLVGLRILMLRN